MFCFINPSQLHQTPGEMERHSAVLADGQANIQNNNQQISATSLPFPSPLPPPLSLTLPFVCVYRYRSHVYKYRCSVCRDVLIYISIRWTAWKISAPKMYRKEPHVLCQCSRLAHWFLHYRCGLFTQTWPAHLLFTTSSCVQIMHHLASFAQILIKCEWNKDTMYVYAWYKCLVDHSG